MGIFESALARKEVEKFSLLKSPFYFDTTGGIMRRKAGGPRRECKRVRAMTLNIHENQRLTGEKKQTKKGKDGHRG